MREKRGQEGTALPLPRSPLLPMLVSLLLLQRQLLLQVLLLLLPLLVLPRRAFTNTNRGEGLGAKNPKPSTTARFRVCCAK